MIKAAGKTGLGVPLLFLGLSGENVTRLAAGEPIRIGVSQMAALSMPQLEIIIHYGRTESAILDELKAHGIALASVSNVPE